MTVPIDQLFDAPGEQERITSVLKIVSERVPTLEGLRVLDLGCRVGAFARAFANAGSTAVGIEGKWDNWSRIPDTPGSRFIHQDVRQLNAVEHGHHNVTLCLGILYHLDAEDAIKLLKAMRQVTTDFAVIDTHIGGELPPPVIVDGRRYEGSWFQEPAIPSLWSSMNNSRSWWFTKKALEMALKVSGWEYIEWLPDKLWHGDPDDRSRLVVS